MVCNVLCCNVIDGFEIADTPGTFSPLPCFLQGGQEHGRQNGDNGDDNKEFNQRKAVQLYLPVPGR